MRKVFVKTGRFLGFTLAFLSLALNAGEFFVHHHVEDIQDCPFRLMSRALQASQPAVEPPSPTPVFHASSLVVVHFLFRELIFTVLLPGRSPPLISQL